MRRFDLQSYTEEGAGLFILLRVWRLVRILHGLPPSVGQHSRPGETAMTCSMRDRGLCCRTQTPHQEQELGQEALPRQARARPRRHQAGSRSSPRDGRLAATRWRCMEAKMPALVTARVRAGTDELDDECDFNGPRPSASPPPPPPPPPPRESSARCYSLSRGNSAPTLPRLRSLRAGAVPQPAPTPAVLCSRAANSRTGRRTLTPPRPINWPLIS